MATIVAHKHIILIHLSRLIDLPLVCVLRSVDVCDLLGLFSRLFVLSEALPTSAHDVPCALPVERSSVRGHIVGVLVHEILTDGSGWSASQLFNLCHVFSKGVKWSNVQVVEEINLLLLFLVKLILFLLRLAHDAFAIRHGRCD